MVRAPARGRIPMLALASGTIAIRIFVSGLAAFVPNGDKGTTVILPTDGDHMAFVTYDYNNCQSGDSVCSSHLIPPGGNRPGFMLSKMSLKVTPFTGSKKKHKALSLRLGSLPSGSVSLAGGQTHSKEASAAGAFPSTVDEAAHFSWVPEISAVVSGDGKIQDGCIDPSSPKIPCSRTPAAILQLTSGLLSTCRLHYSVGSTPPFIPVYEFKTSRSGTPSLSQAVGEVVRWETDIMADGVQLD